MFAIAGKVDTGIVASKRMTLVRIDGQGSNLVILCFVPQAPNGTNDSFMTPDIILVVVVIVMNGDGGRRKFLSQRP